MSAVKVNMPMEMLRDAIFFKKIVEDDPQNLEKKWRYLRASLLYTCIAVEGYLNNFMLNFVQKHKGDIEKEIEDYLTSEISIHTKLTVGLKIITGDSMNKNREPYKTFKEINTIRNKIVHYSWDDEKKIYEEINLDKIKKAIDNAREMIKEIHRLDNSKYPGWVDEV